MSSKDKTKVLIVDDSAVIRNLIGNLVNQATGLTVMATASDPFVAAKKIAKEVPDVIVLDIEMPRMDGLTFIQRIMSQHPIPILVFSSLTEKGTLTGMKALEYGAVEVFNKPSIGNRGLTQKEFEIQFIDKLKAASRVTVNRKKNLSKGSRKDAKQSMVVQPKYSADHVLPFKGVDSLVKTTEKVIAIGASTGGTEAIRKILTSLPHDSSGIVIVQHMPELFTRSFSEGLNEICKINVKEASHGDFVIRGRALIAPGNKHMVLRRTGARYYVEIRDGELVNRHRPSVDVLFRSVAMYAGANALGVILTGMGDDGARGLLEMKNAGAHTVAQDEKSSVVFGMPAEAIRMNAAKQVQSLSSISTVVART